MYVSVLCVRWYICVHSKCGVCEICGIHTYCVRYMVWCLLFICRTWIACVEYMWMCNYDVSLEYGYVEDMEGASCVLWYTNVLCVVCMSDLSMNMHHVSLWKQWDQAQSGIAWGKELSDRALISSSMNFPPLVGVLNAAQQAILPASLYPTGNLYQADPKRTESQGHRTSLQKCKYWPKLSRSLQKVPGT